MRRRITRTLYIIATAGIALSTAGLAGEASAAGSAAGAATGAAAGSAVYDTTWSGYQATGRWFRFAAATVTVPGRAVPARNGGGACLALGNAAAGVPSASITVAPGGGAGSVTWSAYPAASGTFRLSPAVGDRLALSVYYDRHGRDYLTVTDLTRHVTRTARAAVGSVTYTRARLAAALAGTVIPPRADVRLWPFRSIRLTTYSGRHGTMRGPWTTRPLVQTSTGTSVGRVIASPSGLWKDGANFGTWTRALPASYSAGFAGYEASGRDFRFAATTVRVPPLPAAAGNSGFAYLELSHAGGPTPRPYAYIRVQAGGGAGSVRYDALYLPGGLGTLSVRPKPGDLLAISVYYDRHGHLVFAAEDRTTGATATATASAVLAATAPYNDAALIAEIDNSRVSTPPADVRLWQFAGSSLTTYGGVRGGMLGPWATVERVDTRDGTSAGAVVLSPSPLSDGGSGFGVWLRRADPAQERYATVAQ